MSTRVSKSNRVGRPGWPAINMPGVRKLAPSKGVPVNALYINGAPLMVNGAYLTVTSNG